MGPRGRQPGIERAQRGLGERRQLAAAKDQRVDRHHARAAAIGHDGQALAMQRPRPRQRLDRIEQFAGRPHAEHAGTADGRVVDVVGAGERAGVGGGRLGRLRGAARLDGQHRLVAGGGPRGRHELAAIRHRLQVQQDGVRARVAGQVVDHIAGIYIGAVAERDEMGEADLPRARPVQHGGGQGARLRHEGQCAGQRGGVREAGVQADARHHQPDAVGPEDAQQVGPRRLQHGLLHRLAVPVGGAAQAGRQHDRRPRTAPPQLRDQPRYRGGRSADDGQLRRLRQRSEAGMAR